MLENNSTVQCFINKNEAKASLIVEDCTVSMDLEGTKLIPEITEFDEYANIIAKSTKLLSLLRTKIPKYAYEDITIMFPNENLVKLLKPEGILVQRLSKSMKKSISHVDFKRNIGNFFTEIEKFKSIDIQYYVASISNTPKEIFNENHDLESFNLNEPNDENFSLDINNDEFNVDINSKFNEDNLNFDIDIDCDLSKDLNMGDLNLDINENSSLEPDNFINEESIKAISHKEISIDNNNQSKFINSLNEYDEEIVEDIDSEKSFRNNDNDYLKQNASLNIEEEDFQIEENTFDVSKDISKDSSNIDSRIIFSDSKSSFLGGLDINIDLDKELRLNDEDMNLNIKPLDSYSDLNIELNDNKIQSDKDTTEFENEVDKFNSINKPEIKEPEINSFNIDLDLNTGDLNNCGEIEDTPKLHKQKTEQDYSEDSKVRNNLYKNKNDEHNTIKKAEKINTSHEVRECKIKEESSMTSNSKKTYSENILSEELKDLEQIILSKLSSHANKKDSLTELYNEKHNKLKDLNIRDEETQMDIFKEFLSCKKQLTGFNDIEKFYKEILEKIDSKISIL